MKVVKEQKTLLIVSQVASYKYRGKRKLKGWVVSTGNSLIRKKLRVKKSLSNQALNITQAGIGAEQRGWR